MTQPMFVAFVGAALTRNYLTKGVWCGVRPRIFPKGNCRWNPASLLKKLGQTKKAGIHQDTGLFAMQLGLVRMNGRAV